MQGFTSQPNYVSRIVFAESPHSSDGTGEYFIVAQNEKTLYGIQMSDGRGKITVMDGWKIAHALSEDQRAREFANELIDHPNCNDDDDAVARVSVNGWLIHETIDRRERVSAEAFKEAMELGRRQVRMGLDVGGKQEIAFDVEIKGVGTNPFVAPVRDIKLSFEPGNNIGRLVTLKVTPGSFGEDGKYIVVGATRDTLLCVRVNKGYVPSVVTPIRHSDYEVLEVIQDENAVRGIVTKFEKALADFTGTWDREVRRGVITNISLIWQAINLRKHAPAKGVRQIAAALQSAARRGGHVR